jgi:DNA-binding MarR family transcriptional regulator
MNALDTNRNRKNGGVIDWTVSGFRVARPIAANTHVLALAGPLTAGELAQRTGLTTGATTRMIDRLESEGFVRRVPDQADRRRVIVETLPDRDSDINAALEPARLAMFEVFKKFDAGQLRVIFDYFAAATPALIAAIEELRRKGQ